jgi:hypothetical protein
MLYIGNKYISYKDLFFKAINISQYFQNLGLKTNDKVILINCYIYRTKSN